jgi:hypothetical protein
MKLQRGKFQRVILQFIILLLIIPAAGAIEFAGRDLLIPVASRTHGAAGSVWQTDVVITNVSTRAEAIDVAVSFRMNDSSSGLFTAQLAPRESLNLRDIVRETFGFEEAVGYLRIWTNHHNGRLLAWARIYNVGSPVGEFGQNAVGLDMFKLSRNTYLPGLSGVGGNRSNVGITNPSSVEILATLEIYERSGNLRGTGQIIVPPESVRQINNIFEVFGLTPFDGATVQITTSKDVYAYASVVRGDSGDASFITGSGVESIDGQSIVPPSCEHSAPLFLSPRPSWGWIVRFPERTNVLVTIAPLAEKYDFEPEYLYAGFPGFLASLSQSTIAALRCEVVVEAVEQNTSPIYP